MLRRSPRAALAWAAAAVVAVVTAATVVSLLTSLRHQDEAYGALHPVAVARHDLPVGTRVTPADLDPPADPGRGARGRRAHRPAQAIGRVVRGPAAPWRDRDRASPRRPLDARARRRRAGRTDARCGSSVEHGLRPRSATSSTCSPPSIPRRSATGDPTIVVAPAVTGRRGRHRGRRGRHRRGHGARDRRASRPVSPSRPRPARSASRWRRRSRRRVAAERGGSAPAAR